MATLLLDTYSLLFRAFHALPPMTTRAGVPTQALYGFSTLLLKLLREQPGSSVAMARDLPQPTFRRQLYAEYKAGRAAAPSPLVTQLGMFETLVEALGFPMYAAPGFEADDVLATLARSLRGQSAPILVVSGDRDLLQVVDDGVHVLFLGRRGKPPTLYDSAAVAARFGVPAAQLPSYIALVGDASDNIPKLPGIGAVTAQTLIARFGSIGALLERLEEVESERLRATLVEHRAQLLQSEGLARLRADVPLAAPPAARSLTREACERTRELFAAWEFKSLLPRLDALQP
jgi:DNA polymerase I